MNNRENAIKKIVSFLSSDKKILLVTGTFQSEKHRLVLEAVLSQYHSPATVLFRANHTHNFDAFLSQTIKFSKKPRTGHPILIKGGYKLYLDTINSTSWNSTPGEIDIAVVYPIDSLSASSGDDCVNDLIRRNPKKIFLVSWTDNKDISWTDQFSPEVVVFDAEEERPDYHRDMVEIVSKMTPKKSLPGLPKYAKSVPTEFLIKILCRDKCCGTRWARLNKPYPGETALKSAPMLEYSAKCLKCGYEASDNYNWSRD